MLSIRPYESDDWHAITEIHDAARLIELRLTVGEEAFLSLAETAENEGLFSGELWVASDDDRLVGFVAVRGDEITWLYVDPAHHRRGVGRALLADAVERCGQVARTETLVGNEPALELYLSEGFEVVEISSGRLTGNERFAAAGYVLVRAEEADARGPQRERCNAFALSASEAAPQGVGRVGRRTRNAEHHSRCRAESIGELSSYMVRSWASRRPRAISGSFAASHRLGSAGRGGLAV
jgi:ribosomal protein S18 acetylase RimI-like enzyme